MFGLYKMAKASKDDLPSFVGFTETWHSSSYEMIFPGRPELSLSGKNVIIVGGGSGIGRAVALAFAQAGAASVGILGRRVNRLEECAAEIAKIASVKTKVLYEVADVSHRAGFDKALDSVVEATGRIDVLVNCAGVKPYSGAIAKYEAEELLRALEVNVVGTVNIIQAFSQHAVEGSLLLNISSGTAHTAPVFGEGAYNTSKLAGAKLVDQFGSENPQFHVVNVHPGWVPTEMNGMQKEAPDDSMWPLSMSLNS